jgi:hypothetical protein
MCNCFQTLWVKRIEKWFILIAPALLWRLPRCVEPGWVMASSIADLPRRWTHALVLLMCNFFDFCGSPDREMFIHPALLI